MSERSKKNRRRAHRLTRKVIVFLRENEDGWRIKLERLTGNRKLCRKLGHGPDIEGCVDDENMILYVDMGCNVLSTTIHEVLHVLDPDLSETKILRQESFIMKHMTARQAKEIWCYSALLMHVTFTK